MKKLFVLAAYMLEASTSKNTLIEANNIESVRKYIYRY